MRPSETRCPNSCPKLRFSCPRHKQVGCVPHLRLNLGRPVCLRWRSHARGRFALATTKETVRKRVFLEVSAEVGIGEAHRGTSGDLSAWDGLRAFSIGRIRPIEKVWLAYLVGNTGKFFNNLLVPVLMTVRLFKHIQGIIYRIRPPVRSIAD